jgi:hypothetical protein
MNWIGNRISFIDNKGKTTIVISPDKNYLITALMGGWLAMWMTIGITVIWSLFSFLLSQQEEIIIYIFLVFWFYYAFKVSRSFLWLLYGKELIKIDNLALHYKRSLLKYGKSVPYYFENISNFSFSVPEPSSIKAIWESSPWISGGERFHFDYFNKMIRFGRKISEKDAKLLYQLINKRIQERSKK